jgi:hemoglobin
MSRGTIFERYGGFATASKVVMSFYDKILDSDITGPYFDDVDMPRLMDHQTKFVASVMGGPASYTDDMLRQLHSRLNVTAEAFDEMARLFHETLEEFDMHVEDIHTLDREILSRRDLIVSDAE